MPINYKNYPANWKTYIRPEILKRAFNCCEGSPRYPDCRADNYQPHQVTGSRVVLTIAHVDHDLQNNDGMDASGPVLPKEESNLRAWCQRCHLTHDAKHKAARRRKGTITTPVGTVEITGKATSTGTIRIVLGDEVVKCRVNVNDTAKEIAETINSKLRQANFPPSVIN